MADLIALLAVLGGIIFWIWRLSFAVKVIKEVHEDTSDLRRRARDAAGAFMGTRLQRIDDPRLAATILMLQLLRSSSHITEAERTCITGFMREPMQISSVRATYAKAWDLTDPNRVFESVADELIPLLRRALDRREQLELVDMLKAVANAYAQASSMQTGAIDQFRRRLMRERPRDAT